MNITIKIPGLTQAQSTVVVHYLTVFVVAFAAQIVAGANTSANISTLFAGLSAAMAAGVLAVLKAVSQIGVLESVTRLGITAKEKSAAYQLLTGFAVMFVGTLGANLATGAAGKTTFPDLEAAIVAAISGAAFVVIQYAISLIPAPKPTVTPAA